MIERATYDQVDLVIQPLHDLCLVRVLPEPEASGGVLLTRAFTQGEGRSLQGVIEFVGIHVDDPDLLRAHREHTVVVFDDGNDERYPNGLIWWRGGLMPNYLGLVLDEGTEYVLVPSDHIMLVNDGGD